MIGIIGLAGGAASLMLGGATLATGLATGAAGIGIGAATGTVRLAKDSIQALSPIGAGGSQARKRLMERGLIESGVNRTKQLKKMTGKTAGLLGVNVSLASILKQSQIFTGVFGTVFQILGAFVDIMLIPLMPVIKWVLNNMIDFIPHVQAKADALEGFGKRAAAYLENVKNNTDGVWGFIKQLLQDFWNNVVVTWWDSPHGAEAIGKMMRTVAEWVGKEMGWFKGMTEAEKMAAQRQKRIEEELENQTPNFLYDKKELPGLPDIGPILVPRRAPHESLGFGAGQIDEFAEFGAPEGYPGGPPGRSLSTPANKIVNYLDDALFQTERMVEGLINIPGNVVDLMNPFQMGGKGIGGISIPKLQSEDEKRVERERIQASDDQIFSGGIRAVGNLFNALGQSSAMAETMIPGMQGFNYAAQMSGNEYANNSVFSSTENLPPFATVRSPAEFRNMNAANNAIDLTNQAKDNYVARYHDEAAQYEDDLYFQEMMLGVGRY